MNCIRTCDFCCRYYTWNIQITFTCRSWTYTNRFISHSYMHRLFIYFRMYSNSFYTKFFCCPYHSTSNFASISN